jgi:hypothetical protein
MAVTWKGRKVKIDKGSISAIRQQIPCFKRSPFAIEDGGENKYLDFIIRKPLNSDSAYIRDRVHIPIWTVSKRYRLVEHHHVFNALVDALGQIVPDLQSLDATLMITEYGERMWVRFTLANFKLNEGDRYPIVLLVSGLNSVDTTTPLDIKLSWYEPYSETQIAYGMMSGYWEQVNFRKKHLKKKKHIESLLDSEGITEFSTEIKQFLTGHLYQLATERSQYRKWREAEVSREQLVPWIDQIVKEKWEYKEAARVYHIAVTGYDIAPESVKKDREAHVKPSELKFEWLGSVDISS